MPPYSAVRNSHTAILPMEDPVVECLGRRLARVAGMPASRLENLQVTDYTEGRQYKPHYDALQREGESERVKSLFLYLTDDGQGGRHYVEKLTERGNLNHSTLHAGEPVKCRGRTKSGMNAWFRDATRQSWSRRSSRKTST